MKIINYNRPISVKLTEIGLRIYRERYGTDIEVDRDGLSKFQLWEFMGIYGELIFKGEDILEDGFIYIDEDHLKDGN